VGACCGLPVAGRPAPVGCSAGLPDAAHAAPVLGGGGPPPSPTPPSRSKPPPNGYAEHNGPGGTTRAHSVPGYGPAKAGTKAGFGSGPGPGVWVTTCVNANGRYGCAAGAGGLPTGGPGSGTACAPGP